MPKIKSATYEFNEDIIYVNLQRFGENIPYLVNLLRENKLPNENLYLTHIDYDDIFIADWNYLYNSTEKFFSNNISIEYNIENDWQFYFSKSCWLTSELIKNGKFRSYVGAHYNPRIKKLIIHPGSARIKILYLFNNKEQPFIFWNTNEVQYDWMKEHEIVKLTPDTDLFNEYDFTIRPDHGSLIPHFTLRRDGPMDSSAGEYHRHIKKVLENLKIKLNINQEKSKLDNILHRFIDNEYNCEITIKNHTKNTIQKAILIMCTGLSYEDDDLKVDSKV